MGKASREKWERKIQILLQKPVGPPQWYESNLLWVPLTTAFAIILFVVAAMMRGDFRLLLWVALALSVHPSWILIKNIGSKRASVQKVSFLVLLSVSTLGTYGFYNYLAEEPIAVSPSEVKLTDLFDPRNRLKGRIDFNIYNRSDDPSYQIWVKIIIDSALLSAESIDVDFPTLEERARAGEEPRAVSVSAMCVRGRDKDSLKAFLCFIDALKPKQFFQIKMSTNYLAPMESSETQIGRALIKIVSFSSKSSGHFDNFSHMTKGAATDKTIPEAFEWTTMIHFCPDIGEPWKLQLSIACTPNSKRY